MREKSTHTGFIMLVIVFSAVCLFTFASIILVSASQTKKQAEIIAKRQTEYYAACNNAYETIAESLTKDGTYKKTFVINDEENLCIEYTVTDNTYEIHTWQTINIADWNPDNSLNLIK